MGKLRTIIALLIGLCGAFIAWCCVDRFDASVLKGKRVLITGASTGIGEQLAYQYARFGASVIVVARRENELQRVVSKCHGLGAQEAHYIVADLSSLDAAKQLHDSSLKLVEGIDILVLNHVKPFSKYWSAKSDLTRVPKYFEVNTFSYVNLATLFLAELKKSNGSLIVVSSAAGVMGFMKETVYSSNKHALHGFFDSLRQELVISGHRGTSITTCVLGPIDTPNAKLTFEGYEKIKWYPVDECALAIVKGGALRLRQMYFPYFIKVLQTAHFIFPNFMETVIHIVTGEVFVSEVESFPFNLIGYFTS